MGLEEMDELFGITEVLDLMDRLGDNHNRFVNHNRHNVNSIINEDDVDDEKYRRQD